MNKIFRYLTGLFIATLMFVQINKAEAQPYFQIDTINSCPGLVTVTVHAGNLTGACAISLIINFNSTVLTYAGSFYVNPAFPPALITTGFIPGQIGLTYFNTTPSTFTSGVFATFTFNYLGGSTGINFNAGSCDITNLNGDPLPGQQYINGYCSNNGLVPNITANPVNDTVCLGDAAVFTVNSQYTNSYQWYVSTNGGSTYGIVVPVAPYSGSTTNSLHINGVTTGMNGYKFRCIATGTCPPVDTSASATLIVNQPAVVNAGNDISICVGDNATVLGTASNVQSTLWGLGIVGSGTFNTPSAIGTTYVPSTADITAGTIYLTLTGQGLTACPPDVDTLTLTIHQFPVANAGDDTTICTGQPAYLHATGGTSYSWSPALNLSNPNVYNPTANPVVATTYTVTVTENGCSDTDEILVSITPLPIFNAGLDDTICEGVSFPVSGQALNYSAINWATLGDGFYDDSSLLTTTYNPGPDDIAAGAVMLFLQVTPEAPCTQVVQDTLVLTIIPLPAANAGSDKNICYGENVTINATGGTSYIWNTVPPLIDSVITVNPLDTTIYIVSVSKNGCTKNDTVAVNILPLPDVSVGNDTTICYGTVTTITATGGVTYLWNTGALSPSITIDTLVNSVFSVTATGSNGCKNTDMMNLFINTNIIVTSSPANPVICAEDSVKLSVTSNVSTIVTWSPESGLSATSGHSVYASPAFSTTYTALATDALGCTAETLVHVLVNQLPIVQVHPSNTTICKGDTISLTAYGASSYFWNPPTGLSANTLPSVFASPADSTEYLIIGTDANGCIDSTLIKINVNLRPQVNLPGSVVVCHGDNYLLDATSSIPNCTYEWQDGSNQPYLYASEPGYYYVRVDLDGCFDIDTTLIIACSELFIPNTFTPNGDLHNDVFEIKNNGDIEMFKMVIYNRMGEQVFHTENINISWDGTMEGKPCPVGVYHYVLEYLGAGNVLLEKEGKKYGEIILFR